jgi:hypothetical protein
VVLVHGKIAVQRQQDDLLCLGGAVMSEGFFRFQLGLLAIYPDSGEFTLQAIVSACVVEVGRKTFASYDLKELRRLAVEHDADKYAELAPKSHDDHLIFMGAKTLNVSLGRIDSTRDRYEKVQEYLLGLSAAAQNNRINIKTELFWDCHSTVAGKQVDRSLSWREFRVLCALLSKVGSSKYAKCGWQEIVARAAGWCGKSDRALTTPKELARRKSLLLTREQIRATLTRLESDQFFARFQYRRAESWFSFSCGDDRQALVKWISNSKARRAEQVRIQREKDALASTVVLTRKGTNHLPTTINSNNHLTTTINGKAGKRTTINEKRKSAELPPPTNHLTTTSPPPHHHH